MIVEGQTGGGGTFQSGPVEGFNGCRVGSIPSGWQFKPVLIARLNQPAVLIAGGFCDDVHAIG